MEHDAYAMEHDVYACTRKNDSGLASAAVPVPGWWLSPAPVYWSPSAPHVIGNSSPLMPTRKCGSSVAESSFDTGYGGGLAGSFDACAARTPEAGGRAPGH